MQYYCPDNEPEALELRGRLGPCITPLAGGTDVLVSARNSGWPGAILSLRRLGWSSADVEDGVVRIGAMATASRIARDLEATLPLLASSASWLGGPQVRNRATVGGNLCTASPAADMALSLLVLDASVELVSKVGSRTLSVAEFLTGPKMTALRGDELVRAVTVSLPLPGSRPWFFKVGPRSRHFISRVAVAGVLTRVTGTYDLRLGLGAVAPTPVRASRAEAFVRTVETLGPSEIAWTARLAAQDCSPIDDIRASAGYRRSVVENLVLRFLREVTS